MYSMSRREHSAADTCIDMKALHVDKDEASGKTMEEADVHHLLEQNLYKPRRRVRFWQFTLLLVCENGNHDKLAGALTISAWWH